MSKYAFVTVLLICFFTNGYAQKTLSDYSFITIPEQYDFLSEKDKYQINSLTKFLFNKYGFHAFLENEVPENLVICDGLKANVIKKGGIIYTKLQIVINDCHGKEIYRSAEGRSKFKEYNKVFNDALRKAFAGIISLEVNQKEISYIEESSISSEVIEETNTTEVVEENIVEETPNQVIKENTKTNYYFPTRKYSEYSYKGFTFLLRKTNDGYKLYEDKFLTSSSSLLNDLPKYASLFSSTSGLFLYLEKEKTGKAYFNKSMDIIIEMNNEKKVFKVVN